MTWDDVLHEQEQRESWRETRVRRRGRGPIKRWLRSLVAEQVEEELGPMREELRFLRARANKASSARSSMQHALEQERERSECVRERVVNLDEELAREREERQQTTQSLWDLCRSLQLSLDSLSQDVERVAGMVADHVEEQDQGHHHPGGGEGGDLPGRVASRLDLVWAQVHSLVERVSRLESHPRCPLGGEGGGRGGDKEFRYELHRVPTPQVAGSEQNMGPQDPGGGCAKCFGNPESAAQIYSEIRRLEARFMDLANHIDLNSDRISKVEEERGCGIGTTRDETGVEYDIRSLLSRIEELEESLGIQHDSQLYDQVERLANRQQDTEERLYAREREENLLAGRLSALEQRMDRGEKSNGAFRQEMQDTLEKVRYHAEAMDPSTELDDVNTRIVQLEERLDQVISDMESQQEVEHSTTAHPISGIQETIRRVSNQEELSDEDHNRMNKLERRIQSLGENQGAMEASKDRLYNDHRELESRVGALEDTVQALREDVRDAKQRSYGAETGVENLAVRVDGIEQEHTSFPRNYEAVNQLQSTIVDHTHRISRLEEGSQSGTTIEDHASRLEDLERSRRVAEDKRGSLAIRISSLEDKAKRAEGARGCSACGAIYMKDRKETECPVCDLSKRITGQVTTTARHEKLLEQPVYPGFRSWMGERE